MLNFTLVGLEKVDYDIEKNCLLFIFRDGKVKKVENVIKGSDPAQLQEIFRAGK